MRKKCKLIVMLGTSPAAQGGIATVVRNYQTAGILNRWGVKYLVTHVQGSRTDKLKAAITSLISLAGLLVSRRVSVLHVHMSSRASTWRKFVYLLMAMIFRVPCVVHMHSPDYINFFELECSNIQRFFIQKILSYAKYVVVLSASWAADIKRISPSSNTVVVYNSVPLPAEPIRASYESSAPSGSGKLILFLGRIGERKGAFDLIQAASLINNEFKLVFGGDGELDKAITVVKKLGLENKIDFRGWLRGVEKDALLAQADIFVLPSYNEGVPMAILEAMSWGVPIVSTPVGGIPEVVSHGIEGMLVPPGDVHGLARTLDEMLADPRKCQDMGAAGRKRIEKEFAHTVLLSQLEQLWIDAGAAEPMQLCESS